LPIAWAAMPAPRWSLSNAQYDSVQTLKTP
jgi:hypothetical protein